MKKRTYQNDTNNTVHIGPYTIYPGHSREVECCYLPNANTPAGEQSEQALDVWLAGFTKRNQADRIAELPELNAENFAAVTEFYQDKTPGAKFGPALAFEVERRAARAEIEAFAEGLSEMSDDDLQAELLNVADNDAKLQLVQAQLSLRAE